MQNEILFSPPSTPSRPPKVAQFNSLGHYPLNSSPLASSIPSSPPSSPGADAQARRRAQFKSQTVSSPTASRSRGPTRRRVTLGGNFPAHLGNDEVAVPTEEAPRKTFLRERFKARCMERAQKDRERKVKGKRHARSEASSDGDDEIMDEEEDDEIIINDELFHRLISNGRRKQQHQYRLSYAYDVGSSFDPDMEDVNEWEQSLHEPPPISTVPEDLDEEELAAYAEDYDLHLEDLRADELFSLSDLDDNNFPTLDTQTQNKGKGKEVSTFMDDDVDMAM